MFTFQMDELLDWQGRPLALDHPLSFEGFMRRQVFEKWNAAVRPSPDNTHFPSPFAPDAISEKMRAVGGIDTCFGGIGYHGHIAFNDPPISRWYKISPSQMRDSLTRIVALGDDSIVIQSINSSGGSSDLIPPMAVTLGFRDILAARKFSASSWPAGNGIEPSSALRCWATRRRTIPQRFCKAIRICVVHTRMMRPRGPYTLPWPGVCRRLEKIHRVPRIPVHKKL